MIKWIKVDKKLIKMIDEIKEKLLVNDKEFTDMLWIWNSTYYRLKKDKKASIRTIKKLKEFLKKNGYEVE